jgi:hypothetical protein
MERCVCTRARSGPVRQDLVKGDDRGTGHAGPTPIPAHPDDGCRPARGSHQAARAASHADLAAAPSAGPIGISRDSRRQARQELASTAGWPVASLTGPVVVRWSSARRSRRGVLLRGVLLRGGLRPAIRSPDPPRQGTGEPTARRCPSPSAAGERSGLWHRDHRALEPTIGLGRAIGRMMRRPCREAGLDRQVQHRAHPRCGIRYADPADVSPCPHREIP